MTDSNSDSDSDSDGGWQMQPDDSENEDAGPQPDPVAPAPPPRKPPAAAGSRRAPERAPRQERAPKRQRGAQESEQAMEPSLDERNPRSPAYIVREKLLEMCSSKGLFFHHTELRASLLHKLKNAAEFARAAENGTNYNAALSIFTSDFFWRSGGVDSWRIIALMASTCRILRSIDREDQIYEQVSKNMQVAFAKRYTKFGGYSMHQTEKRLTSMALLHVFSTNANGHGGRQALNLPWYHTDFYDAKPSEEQTKLVSKLTDSQRSSIKNFLNWEALSYWNTPNENGEPKWDDATCIAMLYTLRPRYHDPQTRRHMRDIALENNKLSSIMLHSPLALYRKATCRNRTIAAIKNEFWKNEYNRQFDLVNQRHKIVFRDQVEAFRKTRRAKIMQAILTEIIQPVVAAEGDAAALEGVQKLCEKCMEMSLLSHLSTQTIAASACAKRAPTRLQEAHTYARSIERLMPAFLQRNSKVDGLHIPTLQRVFADNKAKVHEICLRMSVVADEPFPTFRKLKKTFRFENLKAVVG